MLQLVPLEIGNSRLVHSLDIFEHNNTPSVALWFVNTITVYGPFGSRSGVTNVRGRGRTTGPERAVRGRRISQGGARGHIIILEGGHSVLF